MNSSGSANRSKKPINKSTARATPAIAAARSMASLEFHQNTVGKARKRMGPKLAGDPRQKIVHRRDALRPDQTDGLYPQRSEGYGINHGQKAQKDPLGDREARRLNLRAEGKSSDLVKQISPLRDEAVRRLRQVTDDERGLVQPLPSQGFENSVRSADDGGVGPYQLDGLSKSLARNLRKPVRGFLIRLVVDAVAGELLPVLDPDPAEAAVSVEDEYFGHSRSVPAQIGGRNLPTKAGCAT